jgi:hypothetical protein
MRATSHLVSTCYAHGYGKYGNCPTLRYICIMPLHMEVVIDLRFGGLSHEIMFTYNKQHQLLWMWLQDVLFYVCKSVIVGGQDGQTWKDHVHINCAPCHLHNVDGQMNPSLDVVPISLWCMLCGQTLRAAIMLICDKSSWGWHMGCLMHQWKKC